MEVPTEAEWEYAAKEKGKRLKWAGTSSQPELGEYAWYGKSAMSGGKTHPVGKKRPNAIGLYDMSSNVWEWVQDWYDSDYYKKSPRDNLRGPSRGKTKVLRGGSWDYRPRGIRAAFRVRLTPVNRPNNIGFRLAISAQK